MFELYIENQQVDVDEGFSTYMTYAIDDIREFGFKNTTVSKTIVLPGTKRNNMHFGNVFKINRSTQYSGTLPNYGYEFNAAVSAKAYGFAGNIQVFKGVVQLMQIVVDGGAVEYEVALFGELGGFVAALGNKKLEDLDFSAYDSVYSLVNITGSWDAAAGSGLYYPLADYGTYSTNKKDWSYRTFRPALYVKEYVDKIFAAAGYSYSCPLFETDRFKGLHIPHNQKGLTKISSIGLDINQGTATLQTVDSPSNSVKVEFQGSTVLGSFTTSDNKTFTYGGTAQLRGRFKLDVTGLVNYEAISDGVLNCRLNAFTSRGAYAWYTFNDTNSSDETFTAHLEFDAVIDNGDTVTLEFQTADTSEYYHVEIYTATMTFVLASLSPVQINIGEDLKINDTVPKNILQTDFIRSIVRLFNLYITEDKDTNKLLNITPFPDFYDKPVSDAVDWTDKIDRSRPMVIKPMSELNGRYYEFKYAADSDYYNEMYRKRYNENYGDRIFDTQFEFAKDKETVELIFAGTPLVGYPGEEKVYPTIFKLSNNVEECVDSVIRIWQRKKITGVASWQIKDGATVLGTYTDYGYAGHFDDPDAPTNDLNFGATRELFFTLATGGLDVNQFNIYYSSYMAEITNADSKLITAYVRLTKKDIADLDFSRWVWIDGGLFRINKLIDYNATSDDTTKAELLKVINTVY